MKDNFVLKNHEVKYSMYERRFLRIFSAEIYYLCKEFRLGDSL